MYYTLIICSSVNGHLSCLYFLAIVIKLCCHGHLYTRFCVNMFSVLFGVYLGVEMPGHVLTLTFRKTTRLFSKAPAPFCTHQQCLRALISPHPHRLSGLSQPSCGVSAALWVLHFPDDYRCEHLSMFLLSMCVSLGECLCKSFAHF